MLIYTYLEVFVTLPFLVYANVFHKISKMVLRCDARITAGSLGPLIEYTSVTFSLVWVRMY